MSAEPNGEQLITSFLDRRHHAALRNCPTCGVDCSRQGITKLVYSHEVCSCDRWDYDHLVEQLWHRACFVSAAASDIERDALSIPVEAATECLRQMLVQPVSAAQWMTPVELVRAARARALRHREPLRTERVEQVERCERILQAARRLGPAELTS